MSNPFEDEQGEYYVLVNEEGQYSLWPAFIRIPHGWSVAHEKDTRKVCLEWVDKNWTDMRPKSLIKAMDEDESFARAKMR